MQGQIDIVANQDTNREWPQRGGLEDLDLTHEDRKPGRTSGR
jgi:hypothetical protein